MGRQKSKRKMWIKMVGEKLWEEAGFEILDKVGEKDGVELSRMDRQLVCHAFFRFHILDLPSKLF